MTISRRTKYFLVFLGVTSLFLTLVLAIPASRYAVLEGLGEMLVETHTVDRADVIVLAVDVEGAGVLEAVDLVKAGVAARVAIFSDPPDEIDREFIKRNVPYYDAAALAEQQLRSLGVPNVERIPRFVTGTEESVALLPEWSREQRVGRVLFIVAPDHSRRTTRMLSRTHRPGDPQIIVHASRYSGYSPHTWWHDRGTVRIQIIETQKLLWDFLRHPFS